MTTFYQLLHATKVDGKVPPGLDGRNVKNKEQLFKGQGVGVNRFFEEEVEYDYFVPKDFGDPELGEGPQFICDMHQWWGASPINGHFTPISEKFKELLEQHKIHASKFYPAKVLFKNQVYNYFVWQLLADATIDKINYALTTFNNLSTKRKLRQKVKEVKRFKNFKQLKLYQKQAWKYNWNFESLVLLEAMKNYDFFYLPKLFYVVTERLKTAIEEVGITGVAFEKCPVPIEFSDEV